MNNSLRRYLVIFRREFTAVAIFSLMTNLLMLVPTLYMLQLYDRVFISKNELTLAAVTLIACFLFLVVAFSEWVRSIIVIKAGVRFDQLLGSKLFALGFSSVLSSRHSKPNEAMHDLTYIRQFMTSSGLFAFFDMPWTLLYIVVLFILNANLGGIAIVFCMIQFCLGVWNQQTSENPLQRVGYASKNIQKFLDSKIRNIETLHVMGMIPHLFLRWQTIQQELNHLDVNANGIQSRNQMINKLVRYTMQSLMLGAAALLAIHGKISIGAMIASNVLIARALQPFDVIVSTWKQFIQARQSVKRLDVLLALDKDGKTLTSAGSGEIKGQVTLKRLEVILADNKQPTLSDINLEIRPGQILSIMGASGSGKTTLTRCLAGICPWQAGEFLIDGLPVASIPQKQWANAIGYLPQSTELIEGTIADNISRFSEPVPADIIAAAQSAGIHDAILRLPHGYDTRINGAADVLSGGQRQLLGLARAIYRQPALLLLDEPNSHLDEHGEATLLSCLQKFKGQGMAIVLVSHRSSILKITDQLLIMEGGKISHYGSRDNVMAELNKSRQQIKAQAA